MRATSDQFGDRPGDLSRGERLAKYAKFAATGRPITVEDAKRVGRKPAPLKLPTRFGRLLAVEELPRRMKARLVLCRCDCGNMREVQWSNLSSGHTVSCGCHRTETATRHGMYKSAEYDVYDQIRQACSNPRNVRYHTIGAKGIKLCSRWQTFEGFIADMGKRPAPKYRLERMDTNQDYSPQNCRWLSPEEVGKRRHNAVLITMNGESRTKCGWCKHYGLSSGTVWTAGRRHGLGFIESLKHCLAAQGRFPPELSAVIAA